MALEKIEVGELLLGSPARQPFGDGIGIFGFLFQDFGGGSGGSDDFPLGMKVI